MPYTHYTIDERNALQAMIGMGLSRNYISVILGKHLSSVYRELNGNSCEGIYTGREAQYEAEDRRRIAKDSPKMNDPVLMGEVRELFKRDYSPDQIAGRLKGIYAENPEKWVSHETIYRYLYQRMAEEPTLKHHFRHPRPHRRKRTGKKERRGQIPDRNLRKKVCFLLFVRWVPPAFLSPGIPPARYSMKFS